MTYLAIATKSGDNRYNLNGNDFYVRQKPLTQRWIRGFEAAKTASFLSDGKAVGTKMGAAIFAGSRLLSVGHNVYAKTRPGNTHRKDNGTLYNTSSHAEQVAIDQIKHYDYSNLKLTIYIARLDAFGNLVTSRPCAVCMGAMKKQGIKIVRFINAHGLPEELVIR